MGPHTQATIARQSGVFMPPHVAVTIQQAFQPVDPYDLWATRYENHRPFAPFFNGVDMIFRQVYRHILLRIPSMYFSRVSRVFRTARISDKDIQDMRGTGELDATPQLVRFRDLWVEFIDQLIKEWKTLNIIAALLLSYVPSSYISISTIAYSHRRYAELFSLYCKLKSRTNLSLERLRSYHWSTHL